MSDVDEIKRRLNIVDVIGEYVKLQKSGANFRARCPFHSEKTPSFFVSPEKQIWHCFGACGTGGDIFRFLMESEGLEFSQALEILARRAGVPLRKFDKAEESQKTTLLHINESAMFFFQKALTKTKGGQKALDYLKKRGINEQSQENFKIGYAPSSWHALTRFLERKGFKKGAIVASGLGIQQSERKPYDRFRARLMFPIFSLTGQVAGFSGRVLREDNEEAKYVNTPQTLIYDKSRELYGLYQAKSALKSNEEVIVMEGNIDVILSHQAGVCHAVATCGTALTLSHLTILSRYTKNLILSFDRDQAGQNASFRAFQLGQQKSFMLYVIPLSQKDPAQIVQEHGSEAWQREVSKKVHFIEYLWDVLNQRYSLSSIEGKVSLINELFSFLRLIPNAIEQGHWLADFARRLKVREEDMFKSFQKFEMIDREVPNNYNELQEKQKYVKKNRIFQDKENLIALWLSYPELCKELLQESQLIKKGAGLLQEIKNEVQTIISDEELILKAQVFWPSEYLARRELLRIVTHMSFLEKKSLLKATA